MSKDYLNLTRLQAEVPGVPEREEWYLWRNRKVEAHFSTLEEGERYCRDRNIKVDVIEYDWT